MGGILDLIVLIVSSEDLQFPTVPFCTVFPSVVYSDHSLIKATLSFIKKVCLVKKKLVRSCKRVNKNVFVSMISNFPIADSVDISTPIKL